MTTDSTKETPLGTKRHVGRTGPRVEPTTPLATLIRYTREVARWSRPELSKRCGISVASIHTLEHDREPRDGELEALLPVLKEAVDAETWKKYGGEDFIAPEKPKAKSPARRTSRTHKAA